MNGCVIVPHAYGLNARSSASPSGVPSPSSSGPKSGATDGANAR